MAMSIKGKTVLITGAARQIGRALALTVARAGAGVIIYFGNSRNKVNTLVGALAVFIFLLTSSW
jgi:NAD(P)-dependent dehydrogenase (short-subunit alcohol dehydrogenase family)